MRISFPIAVLAVSLSATSAGAAVVEEFKAEDWNGMAYADDTTGKLANCSVYAQYQNGVTLYFFTHPERTWTVGLDKADWALTLNEQYDISYRVDSRRKTDSKAVALDKTLLGISLP